jgi:DNA gyrase subunit A
MEMVRDIDEETVDFTPNYDGRTEEPLVLPARFPNLLVNGSAGIAVGMATNIPPHNLREVSEGVMWALAHPDASREELLAAMMERVKGPDFPTGAYIVGRKGIEDAYRTGRGSITMRAAVEVEEDSRGRTQLVVTELPYQVNPDNLAERIAELVNTGKITGISELRDESSGRTGMRLCIVLKRDAVAKVVLNNLYRHTQLQDNFGANMLALVDGVPRTLTLDAFVSNWITHQLEVIQRRTKYRLRKAQERAHILLGLLKAIDRIEEVIALIRKSASAQEAQGGLMKLLEIDELQARAILDMQLRKLAALERQELQNEYDELMKMILDFEDILKSDARQRSIIKEELEVIVAKHGDERRSQFLADEGDMRHEDLIAKRNVVVTLTSGGYVKRTDAALYRQQKRGGRGVKGANLRQDDVVSHFFITTTHSWILFFTNKGRVFRAKAYELPEAGRDARGTHVANVLAFSGDEYVTQVLDLKDYDSAPYLVLATKQGMVKKTALQEYNSNRTGGLIAINLKEDDELISAQLVGDNDDLLLVSSKGNSVRFHADNATLRPMGRATSGVIGIRFKGDDYLLSMDVVKEGSFVFTATDGGFAKRTAVTEWAPKGRGTQGVRAMKLVEERGSLVGALIVKDEDQIFAIASNGVVIRTSVSDIRPTGRDTMGVRLMNLENDDTLVGIARAVDESEIEEETHE